MTAEFQVSWMSFEQLSAADVYEVLRLRQRVFVVEQHCPYLDADGLDTQCWHALGTRDNHLIATARIVPPGLKFDEPAIGRVASAPEVRRTGLGRALMRSAIAQCDALYSGRPIRLAAQRYLEAFYGSLGFVAEGAPFDEDGIEHIEMVRRKIGKLSTEVQW